jgi:glucose/mannose-6-phosphate isomerase
MLDNQNYIAQKDTFDALGLAAATPTQLRHNFGIQTVQPTAEIRNIVFAGMGGSALQAEFIKAWPKLSVPFIVWRDYDLPDFVNEHTLVLVASYSGNTEETLSSLAAARTKGAMIAVMAGGGKLKDEATAHGDVFAEIPKAVQPRMAVFYSFRMLVEVLVAFGVINSSTVQELEDASNHLENSVGPWKKEVLVAENPAKQLAEKLVGKTPIIYSSAHLSAAAYKWKIGANENGKNTAWYNLMPEFDHNEFMGWTSHPVEKPFAVIDLISEFDHPRIQKRFEVGDRLLSGMRPHSISVWAQGETALEQLLYLVLFGDFVTIYMGILNGVNPSPVALIEKFKTELG